MSRFSPLLAASAALVITSGLAGCSSGTPVASPPASSAAPTASASPEVADYSDLSSYYPVAEGNTWTYEIKFPKPIGTVTDTETMTSVVPDGDAVRVTIERTLDFPKGTVEDTTDSVLYVFYPDGSLEVPYQTLPGSDGTTVTVKDGTLRWPTDEEFEAGTKKTGTIEASVESAAGDFDQVIDFTLQGKGEASVTVPFGRFDARKLSQKFDVSIPDLGIDGLRIDSTIWLVDGVGMVKSEVPGLLSGDPVTTKLISFTPAE